MKQVEWLNVFGYKQYVNFNAKWTGTGKGGASIYFAEYVPAICMGMEELKRYFELYNEVAD